MGEPQPSGEASGRPPAAERPRIEPGASFWRLLPTAFVYPFLGEGKWMILGGGVGMVLFRLAGMILPLAGMVLGVVLLGFFAMYAMRNIASSAGGDPEPSGWPDLGSLDDLVSPLLHVIGTTAFSLGPFLVYVAYFWIAGRSRDDLLSAALLAWGLFYLPMALLGVALHDSLAGVNPLRVLPAIVKVLPAYVVALAAIAAACAMTYPLAYLARVPLLGEVLGAMFEVYWLTVVTRIIGLVYCSYQKRLNWFPED